MYCTVHYPSKPSLAEAYIFYLPIILLWTNDALLQCSSYVYIYWQCHFEKHLPVPIQSSKKGGIGKNTDSVTERHLPVYDEEKLLIATCSEFDHYWTYWQCHFEKHLPLPTQSCKKGDEEKLLIGTCSKFNNYWNTVSKKGDEEKLLIATCSKFSHYWNMVSKSWIKDEALNCFYCTHTILRWTVYYLWKYCWKWR